MARKKKGQASGVLTREVRIVTTAPAPDLTGLSDLVTMLNAVHSAAFGASNQLKALGGLRVKPSLSSKMDATPSDPQQGPRQSVTPEELAAAAFDKREAGKIAFTVRGSDIVATLTEPPIKLAVPGSMVQAFLEPGTSIPVGGRPPVVPPAPGELQRLTTEVARLTALQAEAKGKVEGVQARATEFQKQTGVNPLPAPTGPPVEASPASPHLVELQRQLRVAEEEAGQARKRAEDARAAGVRGAALRASESKAARSEEKLDNLRREISKQTEELAMEPASAIPPKIHLPTAAALTPAQTAESGKIAEDFASAGGELDRVTRELHAVSSQLRAAGASQASSASTAETSTTETSTTTTTATTTTRKRQPGERQAAPDIERTKDELARTTTESERGGKVRITRALEPFKTETRVIEEGFEQPASVEVREQPGRKLAAEIKRRIQASKFVREEAPPQGVIELPHEMLQRRAAAIQRGAEELRKFTGEKKPEIAAQKQPELLAALEERAAQMEQQGATLRQKAADELAAGNAAHARSVEKFVRDQEKLDRDRLKAMEQQMAREASLRGGKAVVLKQAQALVKMSELEKQGFARFAETEKAKVTSKQGGLETVERTFTGTREEGGVATQKKFVFAEERPVAGGPSRVMGVTEFPETRGPADARKLMAAEKEIQTQFQTRTKQLRATLTPAAAARAEAELAGVTAGKLQEFSTSQAWEIQRKRPELRVEIQERIAQLRADADALNRKAAELEKKEAAANLAKAESNLAAFNKRQKSIVAEELTRQSIRRRSREYERVQTTIKNLEKQGWTTSEQSSLETDEAGRAIRRRTISAERREGRTIRTRKFQVDELADQTSGAGIAREAAGESMGRGPAPGPSPIMEQLRAAAQRRAQDEKLVTAAQKILRKMRVSEEMADDIGRYLASTSEHRTVGEAFRSDVIGRFRSLGFQGVEANPYNASREHYQRAGLSAEDAGENVRRYYERRGEILEHNRSRLEQLTQATPPPLGGGGAGGRPPGAPPPLPPAPPGPPGPPGGMPPLRVKEIAETTRAVSAFDTAGKSLAATWLTNTAKAAFWASGITALYGTVQLATAALRTMIEAGAQTARLAQVFKGVGGSALELSDDVMRLAAVEGRGVGEAMEAAVQYSRLGLTRQQVNLGVRASLMAANVAEIDAAQATEHLSAIMAGYNMQVEDLSSKLGFLNAISNQNRSTNREVLEGLARSALVAKQAGFSFEELTGRLAAATAQSGLTGSSIGTAFKTVLSHLSNPELQRGLRKQFQIEVMQGGTGEIKPGPQILGEIFTRYQQLNEAQKQSMTTMIAGATQANRLQAILDSYVKGQVLAINAQLQLNSAEQESARIRGTLKSRLAGLTAEIQRTVVAGDRGLGLTAGLATAAENLREMIALYGDLYGWIAKIRGIAADTIPAWLNRAGIQLVDEKTFGRPDFTNTIRRKLGIEAGDERADVVTSRVASAGIRFAKGQPVRGALEFASALREAATGDQFYREQRARRKEEADAARGRLDAEMKTEDLLITTQRTIADRKISKETRLRMIEELSELNTVERPAEFRAALGYATQQDDGEEINRLFREQIEARHETGEKRRVELKNAQAAERAILQKQIDEKPDTREEQKTAQARLKELERAPRTPETARARAGAQSQYDAAVDRGKERVELEKQMSALLGEQQKKYKEITDDLAAIEENRLRAFYADEQVQSVLAAQKATLEGIAQIYRDMPAQTVIGRLDVESAALERQQQFLNRRRAEINASNMSEPMKRDYLAEIDKEEVEIVKGLGRTRDPQVREMARQADRNRITRELVRADLEETSPGGDELQQFSQRVVRTEQLIQQKEVAVSSGRLNETEQVRELVALMELRNQQDEEALEMVKLRARAAKEEFDYSKQLLTASPAERIRRQTAEMMMRRGVTPGQWMSYTPDLQRELMEAGAHLRREEFLRNKPRQSEIETILDANDAARRKDLERYNQLPGINKPVAFPPLAGGGSGMDAQAGLLARAFGSLQQNVSTAGRAFQEDLALMGQALTALRDDLNGFGKQLAGVLPSSGGGAAPYVPGVSGAA